MKVLGGRVIHQQSNDVWESQSTFVGIGDSVIEYAVPTSESSAAWEACAVDASVDTYYSLTFEVDDLDRVAKHLGSCGLAYEYRDEMHLVTDPAHTLGVPWGFTTDRIPNDTINREHV